VYRIIFASDHTHKHTHTYTLCMIPLDEGLAHYRDLDLTTQHSQETDIHAPSRIWIHNPIKWVATSPHFRLPRPWEQPEIKLRSSVVYTVVPYCIQF